MKMKKVIAGISAFALLTTMGVTAFAAMPRNNTNSNKGRPAITQSQENGQRPTLTDKQKADMKATQEKIVALTDAQKAEITAQKDKVTDVQTQMIDKYRSWNLISEQTATEMKARIADKDNKACEKGFMPMGIGFAAGNNRGMMGANPDCTVPNQAARMRNNGKRGRPALTEEQKTEMQTRQTEMKAMQEKIAAITDEQKAEIYTLQDEIFEIKTQIIDKYLAWNIIDEKIATDMKAKLTEKAAQIRENGKLPMFGGFKGYGKGGHRGALCTAK